ncbi:chlorophyllase [Solwaraspora sp. WMMD1047]|uniref:alpha/beta hydrolase family protein n=1 Tax=Solwaraspora sp. WMMD1047 TaxID=3016102 RepID=UPI00241656A7|nr:chlorophyllase [Solwaraspora sp. WMMD1047]MDG4833138.1 chlorophyllase [Solwaraspora sp. WMMD1047]
MRRHPTAVAAAALIALGLAVAGCSPAPDRSPNGTGPTTAAPTGTAGPATPSTGPATPPAGRAPAERFDTATRQLEFTRGENRPLDVTVWYPVGVGGDVARGRFPVVLFSHGLGGRPADYRTLLSGWAAAGFVVAAPSYPHTSRGVADFQLLDVINQPADASHVLTGLLALDDRAGDPFQGHLDPERVAAAGHSAGGVTTIGLFTAGRDDRLDAGIVLAGSALGVGTAFSGASAPQLFIHGELDEVVSYQSGLAAYDRVPWPKAMLSLPDGDHGGSLSRSGDPALRVVAETTVEFLRWSLYGDPAAKGRLPAAAARGGLATLDDNL